MDTEDSGAPENAPEPTAQAPDLPPAPAYPEPPAGSPYPQAYPGTYPLAPPIAPEELAGPKGLGRPPTPLTVSFWCWLVAAVIDVVSGLLLLGDRQMLLDQASAQGLDRGLTPAQLQEVVTFSMWLLIVRNVVVAGLFVLFAFKVRTGRNWARIVLAIVAAGSLVIMIIEVRSETFLSYIGGILAVVAAILSYTPQATQYIAATTTARVRARSARR